MGDHCGNSAREENEIVKLRACLARAEANVAMVEAKWRAEAFANGKTCPHCGWDEPQCDCQTLVDAVKAAVAAAATEAHPGDHERTMAESHCSRCTRCQAYKQMADDEAKRHGLRATSYREELLQIVSYLGHYDQDANHAWMVRRIRAVLAGKDPNTVEGWSMLDGVPAPTGTSAKVVGTAYPPPKQLWFHFHPAPHMVTPDGEKRLAAGGDLWHDPYESKEEAEAALGESAMEGWDVVGPYTLEDNAKQLLPDGPVIVPRVMRILDAHVGKEPLEAIVINGVTLTREQFIGRELAETDQIGLPADPPGSLTVGVL